MIQPICVSRLQAASFSGRAGMSVWGKHAPCQAVNCKKTTKNQKLVGGAGRFLRGSVAEMHNFYAFSLYFNQTMIFMLMAMAFSGRTECRFSI
jgi:hypothetical protein